MADKSIPLDNGTTVSLVEKGEQVLVILSAEFAPVDMRVHEAGRIISGTFQPRPFAEFGMRPDTLRAIADLIEAHDTEKGA